MPRHTTREQSVVVVYIEVDFEKTEPSMKSEQDIGVQFACFLVWYIAGC